MLQMAVHPDIIHIVGHTEANHAATAEEVIEGAVMVQEVIETALRGNPDMTADSLMQHRKLELIKETHLLIDAIRSLDKTGDDPFSDPRVLTQAVSTGLLDAPQLVNNAFAPAHTRTRSIEGAIRAVDDQQHPITESRRISKAIEDSGILL
jgi:hypothetical protein